MKTFMQAVIWLSRQDHFPHLGRLVSACTSKVQHRPAFNKHKKFVKKNKSPVCPSKFQHHLVRFPNPLAPVTSSGSWGTWQKHHPDSCKHNILIDQYLQLDLLNDPHRSSDWRQRSKVKISPSPSALKSSIGKTYFAFFKSDHLRQHCILIWPDGAQGQSAWDYR